MATLREIRTRIRSVRNTAQITKTMEMVSAAKLRRAQTAVESARPYAKLLGEVLQNLAQASGDVLHPAFVRREVRARVIVLVTSDRGLAGAFNANLIRAVEALMRESPRPTRLVLLGKKGYAYFRRRNADVFSFRDDMGGVADWKYAEGLSRDLLDQFLSGAIDEVDLVTTHFKSALSREIVVEPLLPLGSVRAAGTPARDYIFEPGPEEILARIVPYFLAMRLYTALAESAASEHGARMIAMGSATKNANEMIQNLTLHMNRTRQATITREIVEIVGGAEALK
ncbi:MAG TPA: ATP synthase F1 subunit gamma [Candidatus Binatia bacterium]|nr:ATP synthase F1 subunit gamma [Candidatus Binatia bacterium]